MKLELKHLAPYLLTKLKVKDLYENSTRILMGINKNHTEPIKVALVGKDLAVSRTLEEIKPILRPLSDLDKLNKEFETESTHGIGLCFNNDGIKNLDDIWLSYQVSCASDFLPIFEYLFKNHFDVFGLIEKGIAIDINTLK